MLIRLAEVLFIAAAIGFGGLSLWRMLRTAPVRASTAHPAGKGLSRDELDELHALGKHDAHVKEALALRDAVRSVGGAIPDVDLAVDDALRQLGKEAEILAGIDKALLDTDEQKRAAAVLAAHNRLRDARGDDERRLAQEILDGLERQKDATDALARRRTLVAGSIERAVIELREVRLALLDAAASPAGVAGSAPVVVERLRTATERLSALASAGDEVARVEHVDEHATVSR